MRQPNYQIVRYLQYLFYVGIFTMVPMTDSLADTPGATNYIDPSGYPSSWPSTWTPYTIEGESIADQTNGGGDGTKGAAPSNETDVAPCGGESVFFSRDANNIYFRLCLNGNPNGNNTDPFTQSGSWSLLIDVDGDGFREFVVSLDGKSSQAFDDAPDNFYVLYKNDLRQDFADSDLQIGNGGSATVGDGVLWVQDSALGDPTTSVDGESNWEVTETGGIRDFERTRVVDRGDGTYYLDIQVPLAALDATNLGGTKITSDTPIAFAFATAASNTDPVQKDLAFPGNFIPQPDSAIPFGDVVTGDGTIQDAPSINSVTGGACGANISISAEVVDSLANDGGNLISSISQVEFFYYPDYDRDGIADDGQSWVSIGNGTLATDTINPWQITWDTTNLFQGQYLLKAIATDSQTTPNVVDSTDTDSTSPNYNAATNETTPIIGTLDNTCGVPIPEDYGDAPVDYDDTVDDDVIDGSDDPAHHKIRPNLYLGSVVPDEETTPQSSTNANGDDLVASPQVDDEEGIDSLAALSTETTNYSAVVTINNTTSNPANVYGWIDFDRDGEFDEDERASVSNGTITLDSNGKVPTGSSGTVTLTWANLGSTGADLTDGNSYLRVRTTTDELDLTTETTARDDASVGVAGNGEVEDYPLTILGLDYGDAPDAYGDASHEIPSSPTIYLGSIAPDSETDTQLGTDGGAAAAGDDNDGGDDEDAFNALANAPITGSYNLDVPLSNTSGGDTTLHAWIDFNQNDVFEAEEYQSATVNNNDTSARLNWTVPVGTVVGDTHARFRLSSDALSDDTGTSIDERSLGNASNGEVEDYPISMTVPIYDYGDAPDTGAGTGTGNYQTTDSDGGAAQVVIDEVGQILSLGSEIDVDDGSLQDSNAEADDNNGTPDDEDGVSSFPTLTAAEGQTYTVSVTARNNVPGVSPANDAYLVGFIDFNKDGDFLDDGEQSATVTVPSDALSSNGALQTFDVTFTTPAGMTTGTTYARFRLGQVEATVQQATGASAGTDNGEVEDYKVQILDSSTYNCPTVKADIWFANDESGSVSDAEFTDALNFLYQLSDEFIYDDDTGVKAGIVGWASSVDSSEIVIPITESFGDPGDSGLIDDSVSPATTPTTDGDGQGIRELYNEKKSTSSGTRLDYATNYLADLIEAGNGRRTDTPQIVVMLTDANNGQIVNASEGGGSNWITEVDNLKNAGPDGSNFVLIIIDEAATAYNGGGDAKTFIDEAVGDGQLLVVPTYTEAADATKGYVETASQSVCDATTPTASDPNLLLVKRITAINPGQSDEVRYTTFVNDDGNDDGNFDNDSDNDPNWPENDDTYLPGAINVTDIEPGDEVEYTIYVLSNGEQAATNVQICDVIPDNMSFVGNSFDNDSGIALLNSSASGATATNLSNAADTDGGTFYAPGTALPTVTIGDPPTTTNLCQKIDSAGDTVEVDANNNINGAVVVEIDTIPKADNPGDPANSYGFIRFRAEVQ